MHKVEYTTADGTSKSFEFDNSDESFIRAMDEVVKEHGREYVFKGWSEYITDGKPACMIGHVLLRIGVPVEWFTDMRATDIPGWTRTWNNRRAENMMLTLGFSQNICYAADGAQRMQDGAMSWGYAHDEFKSRLAV